MRLGISSHTFAWAVGVPGYPRQPEPLTAGQLLERAIELQVGVVQIADNLPLHELSEAELQSVVGLAAQRGLDLEVGTCGIDPDHLGGYLELALRLRSPLVRTLLDTNECEPTPTDVVDRLRQTLPEFERAGVCLAIENHDRLPAATLAQIIESLDSPAARICLDTANSLGCGEGLETVLGALAKWVVNVHVKDFEAERLPHQKGFTIEGRPAGRGRVDVRWLLSELRARGRDPNLILELWVPPAATIIDTVAREAAWAEESVRYLREFVTM